MLSERQRDGGLAFLSPLRGGINEKFMSKRGISRCAANRGGGITR